MLVGATDIIPNFILRWDLGLAENILLNYLILYKDKWVAMWYAFNFMSRSATQKALSTLTVKYAIISILPDGSVQLNREFKKHIVPIKVNNKVGRPSKLAIAEFDV